MNFSKYHEISKFNKGKLRQVSLHVRALNVSPANHSTNPAVTQLTDTASYIQEKCMLRLKSMTMTLVFEKNQTIQTRRESVSYELGLGVGENLFPQTMNKNRL